MLIVTWNVLHKVHSDNWGEPPRCGFDEFTRIEAIAERVKLFAAGAHAVCLQEVSGDQLAALNALGVQVLSLAYPRVPKPRRGPVPLNDLSEHLVVLATGAAEVITERVFASDPGKGFLAVRTFNGLIVVSAHVSFGDKGAEQLAELAAFAREQRGVPVIIGGDFNADARVVGSVMGEGFEVAKLVDGLPTRPRAEGVTKSQNIDHIVGHLTQPLAAAVEDGAGLSDHNPVWARFG